MNLGEGHNSTCTSEANEASNGKAMCTGSHNKLKKVRLGAPGWLSSTVERATPDLGLRV